MDNNFVFDTTAINRILESMGHAALLQKALSFGFIYHMPYTVDREMAGIKDLEAGGIEVRQSEELIEKQKEYKLLRDSLQIQHIGEVHTLLHNAAILDGTGHHLDDEGPLAELFADIHHNNLNHIPDAVIAEVALRRGYTLLSADKRLHNRVKAHYPNNVLNYVDFIGLVEKVMSSA